MTEFIEFFSFSIVGCFLPNAISHRHFSWRSKFGEIDPYEKYELSKHFLSANWFMSFFSFDQIIGNLEEIHNDFLV